MRPHRWKISRLLTVLGLCAGLTACGGGGGGGDINAEPQPPVSAPTPPTSAELASAARFGARASFGLSYAEVQALADVGPQAWLQAQFDEPASYHVPTVTELVQRRDNGEFEAFEEDIEYLILARRLAWWDCAVRCEDQLRQRVAFALSEIMVVSDNVDLLIVSPYALSSYYDTLLEHAFGNFRDLLRAVTLHPAMGFYLSHLNNNRSNALANTFPDENFAREVMQLFSIGLHELNADGSQVLNAEGRPIPTYDNNDIREFAKVFTGLSYGGQGAAFGRELPNFLEPMQMFDANHEPGEKRLLNGVVLPAGQTGMEDIDSAIDNLFEHPNVGPFIGRLLIQRLVTSNPSPAYIQRVSNVFAADEQGVRGNMRAVISAILLDEEATAAADTAQFFGKLREPVVRYLNLLRVFEARSESGFVANTGYRVQFLGRQHPLSAPSVFNFFLPTHSPNGDIANAGLVAPEFEIINSSSVVNMTNLLDIVLFADQVTDSPPPFESVSLQYDAWASLANNPDDLVERLDIVLTHGSLHPDTRDAIRNVLQDVPVEDNLRVKVAIFMVMTSPDYVAEL